MTHPLEDPRIDWNFLRSYGFDEGRFRVCADAIARGELSEATAVIARERISTLRGGEVTEVSVNRDAETRYRHAGEEALRRSEIAVVVVNGGMATRFGGLVKGVVEVFDNESFLSLKGEDIRRANQTYGARTPLVLMNSFATHEATMEHLAAKQNFDVPPEDIYTFLQSVSLRLNPNGSLFIGDDGKPSYHAPGHGDFFQCLRKSGILGALLKRGIKTVLFSNVDNLGATIDPTIIGHHLLAGADMSAEITEKRRTASGEWDKGGAPAYVDEQLQIVEGFRFPSNFQQEKLQDFSTNNFLFKAAAIDRDHNLERHVVKKKVDGRPALQLESITCEASGLYDSSGQPLLKLGLFRVLRDGPRGRFFPVKEPSDLARLRESIRRRLEEGWASRERPD